MYTLANNRLELFFFFSSRRRHTRSLRDWSSDVCSSDLERRLELIAEAGIEETLVVEFDLELAQLEPEEFADAVLRRIGTEVVVAGSNFRFGRARGGDLALLERLGFDVRAVPFV